MLLLVASKNLSPSPELHGTRRHVRLLSQSTQGTGAKQAAASAPRRSRPASHRDCETDPEATVQRTVTATGFSAFNIQQAREAGAGAIKIRGEKEPKTQLNQGICRMPGHHSGPKSPNPSGRPQHQGRDCGTFHSPHVAAPNTWLAPGAAQAASLNPFLRSPEPFAGHRQETNRKLQDLHVGRA